MNTTKIVDVGSTQTLACRVIVNGDVAYFDPAETEANIKAAIEAVGAMSGHTVTVTELIAARKWQFAFDFTLTTFAAGKASDLSFSNPAAIDLTDHSGLDIGVSGFPTPADGATLFFRYKNPQVSPIAQPASFGESGTSNVIQIYSFHSGLAAGYFGCDATSYGVFPSPDDTEWHTLAIRIPDAATLGHNALLSDVVVYVDREPVTLSFGTDGAVNWGAIDTFRLGQYFPNTGYSFGLTLDHAIVIAGDIGDAATKALHDYATAGAGCVTLLKGDEGSGTTVNDWSSVDGGGAPNGPNGGTSSGNWVTGTTTTVITDGGIAASHGGLLIKKKRFLQRAA